MINTEQLCLACGLPVPQSHGPIPRLYCNKACKQKAYRQKKAQEATEQQLAMGWKHQDTQARIAELEQECSLYASHIAELESQVHKLRERLDVERRYLLDSKSRPFRAWLRKCSFPEGSFASRLLADTRYEKPRYSKSWYEATLPTYGYSAEDIATFRDLWKAMLLEQS